MAVGKRFATHQGVVGVVDKASIEFFFKKVTRSGKIADSKEF
jgi:hypothetical protein